MRASVAVFSGLLSLGVLAACTEGPGPSQGGVAPPLPEPTTVETTAPPRDEPREPVVVVGAEGVGADAGAVAEALARFAESSGIAVDYVVTTIGDRELVRQTSTDGPGDVFLIESNDVLLEHAVQRTIRPLPRAVDAAIGREWAKAWIDPARFGELLYGVPLDARTESLIWYQPSRLAAAGYDPPETWTGLVEMANAMVVDELTPFCGFSDESERAQAFVDWTFDLFLRSNELSSYDSVLLADGGREFDDLIVFNAWTAMRDLWVTPGIGFEVSPVGDDAELSSPENDLTSGRCFMLRSGPDVIDRFPDDTTFADGGDNAVDVVVFPGPRGDQPMIADVTYAVSRSDNSDVWAVMEYLGSGEFARNRRAAQADGADSFPAFLSVALDQDLFELSLLELSLLDTAARTTGIRAPWDEVMARSRLSVTLLEALAVLSEGRTITDALETIDAS